MARAFQVDAGQTFGSYRVVRELGHGGFGVVCEAEDERSGARIALKTIRTNLGGELQKQAFKRFMHEIQAVRKVIHPNVVKLHDYGHVEGEDGRPATTYYAMELIDGRTLDEVVRTHGPMPARRAVNLVRQAALGLDAAHALGIVHRDVKPSNIMVATDDRAVVMDFGVCKLSEVTGITAEGQVLGTVRYLAPEQVRGEEADGRCDVFALGAVLFFLLSGAHLREHGSMDRILEALADDFPRQRVTPLPVAEELKTLLVRSLASARENRFAGARELADALDEVTPHLGTDEPTMKVRVGPDDVPAETTQSTTPTHPAGNNASRRGLAITIAASTVALAVGWLGGYRQGVSVSRQTALAQSVQEPVRITSTPMEPDEPLPADEAPQPPPPGAPAADEHRAAHPTRGPALGEPADRTALRASPEKAPAKPKLVDGKPRYDRAVELGHQAILEGRFQDAVVFGRAAVAENGRSPEGHKILGVAYSRLSNFCAARFYYELALKLSRPGPAADRIREILKEPQIVNCNN